MWRIARLECAVQTYAWGSRTALARLRGEPVPSPTPQAELWIGAHPAAPSHLVADGRRVSLADLVSAEPEAVLGPAVAARFGPRLPFLAKLLAAGEPLSIQAHPDARQAREGFAREDAQGIALDSGRRCYRDPFAKPELVCALEPFEALCGLRPPGEIRELAQALGAPGLAREVAAALADPAPLAALLAALLRLAPERRAPLVAEAALAAAGSSDPALAWIPRLHALHPGDPGALAPLFLHHLRLAPGEAVFLAPGELHGHLEGFVVEVMASSDNVLRGGLTQKYVDVDALLRILRCEARAPQILRPARAGVTRYAAPAEEFALSALELAAGDAFASGPREGVEILACTRGALCVAAEGGAVELRAGEAALAPWAAGEWQVSGDGLLHRVGVPGGAATAARSAPTPPL